LENGEIINLMKYRILPIPGDASFRKYFRIISKRESKIIVYAEKEKYKNLFAYSAINAFLRKNGIFTPKLYEENFSKNVIIIEDFGNLTFYKILIKKRNKLPIYKKLVDTLIKIQKIKIKYKIKSISKKNYFLDRYSIQFLQKESDLFFDWYLPLFLSKKKSFNIKKKTRKILARLYKKLHFPNSYFVHRDYHLQNLMKVREKVGVIDTQDALIGNPAYDLVSLIDDVRIKTSSKLKDKIFNYYLNKTTKIKKVERKNFFKDFNILSVQRSLKIIGIFSRLFKRDKKKQYLKLIPYTWKLLEARMKTEAFLELKQILDKNVPVKFRNKILTK
tara:strand:+ start:601 stop:1596 length:996 start_codon:yes stop_codon:yes gene_type:complete